MFLVDPSIQRPIEPINRWTDLAERVLAPVIASGGGDVLRLELTRPPIDGIVDAHVLAEFRECAPPTAAALTALLADPGWSLSSFRLQAITQNPHAVALGERPTPIDGPVGRADHRAEVQ